MTEAKLRDALQRFDAAAKAGDGPGISAALNEVEALHAEHGRELHPQLAHFLEGRSYAKALAWLGGESGFGRPSSPPGGCAGTPGADRSGVH
jgi:hypothetical protein